MCIRDRARTFQNIRLFGNMSVEDNVRIGLHNQVPYGMFSGIFRLPRYWKQEKKQHERDVYKRQPSRCASCRARSRAPRRQRAARWWPSCGTNGCLLYTS